MLNDCASVMLGTGISPSRKNSKSSTMRASGGYEGGCDAFVVEFGGLTPLWGTKPGVSSQGNPVKNGGMGVIGWQHFDVSDHPKGHFGGDHVTTFGYVLVVLEGSSDNLDEIGFGGAW